MSGFLGSGKTTLVGELLAEAQAEGVKLAIISNEFGDTGIDRALLDAGQDGLVELDGGCVCCRLSDALGETVEGVIARARPDRLIVETSGLAVPGEVVLAFWRPPIAPLVSEVSVVVVVDGERFLAPERDPLMDEQLEAADLVVLNKCDLLDARGNDAAEAGISEVTGGRPVVRTVRGRVPMAVLFPPDVRAPTPRAPVGGGGHHAHDRFDSFVLEFPGEVSEDAVRTRVLAERPVRAKGFVRTADGLRLVQGVGARIEMGPPSAPVPPHLEGKVVLICAVAPASEGC